MTAPLKAIDGNADLADPDERTGASRPAPRRACWRWRRRSRRTARWRRWSAPSAPTRRRSSRPMPRMSPRPARPASTGSFIDRLTLTQARVDAMADGIAVVRNIADPVGVVTESWQRPNGMTIERVRVPLGVVAVIFESRPNVAADAGVLCLKSGNAVILRGGSDSFRSCRAIHDCLVQGLREAGLPEAAITLVPTRDRAAVGLLLSRLERRHRRDRAARRQEPGRARRDGSARAGVRASRRRQPRLCRSRRQSRHGQIDRAERQDAPHRRLRRGRDAAGRSRRARRPASSRWSRC